MYTKSTLINIRWLLLLSYLLFLPGCAMPWPVLKTRDDKQRSEQLFSSEETTKNVHVVQNVYVLLIFICNISVNYFFDRCNMLLERKRRPKELERKGSIRLACPSTVVISGTLGLISFGSKRSYKIHIHFI